MFYIPLANTINEQKHFEKMGVAIWLYIYFLDKVTSIDEFGNGLVTFGNIIKLEDIKHIPYRTTRRYHDILQKEGYIISDRANRGVRVKVTKCKKIFGGREDKNVLSQNSDRTKVDAQNTSDRTNLVSDRTKVDAILYNKTVTRHSLTRQKGFSLKSEKQILSPKGKNMRTYNEEEHYKEKAIDLDTGEEINPPPPKAKKNEQAHALRKYFYIQCKKHLQTTPKENKTVDYLMALGAIKSLSKPQITELVNEWFSSGKEAKDLIQITRCFSTNNINIYKANHTSHEN